MRLLPIELTKQLNKK